MGMTLGVHGAAMQAGAHMPLRKIPTAASCSALARTRRSFHTTARSLRSVGVVSGLDVGGNHVLDQTLTREEALIAHTRSNAYFFFRRMPSAPSKSATADLAVLYRDYMTVPVVDIKHIHPTLTMVGGRVVFSAAK